MDDGERRYRMFCRPIHTGIGEVMVRPIRPADAAMARSFVEGLSATSRYYRFFAPLKGLSPGLIDRFTRTNPLNHVALVGIAHVEGRQRIVGEARYAVNADGTSADIAVAVADAWQRLGIGRGLLGVLERIAAAGGVTLLAGESLAFNDTFLSFARAFGFRVGPHDADRRLLRIEKRVGECPPTGAGG